MFFQFTVLLANSLATLYVRLTPTPNPSPVKREGLSECVSPSLPYGGQGQGLGDLKFPTPSLPGASMLRRLLTRENLFALAFCILLILLIIVTADTAPPFIYRGF